MKEGALRKKLQEIGIPTWGSKDLMKRRHIEWLNIHNSNCDADDSVRKTKRQLVKELEGWENTQGGKADIKESKVMRKDFDGNGYAKSHKTDFDDLIARARKKKALPISDGNETKGETPETTQQDPQLHPEPQVDVPEASNGTEPQHQPVSNTNHVSAALMTDSGDAHSTNKLGSTCELKAAQSTAPPEEPIVGIQNPFQSPSRKGPMFAMPEEPVKEVDIPTS